MATLLELLKQEITMRRIGLAIVMLAAIPAVAIPLLACVLAISAPAALIAGIAGFSSPSHAEHNGRAAAVTYTADTAVKR